MLRCTLNGLACLGLSVAALTVLVAGVTAAQPAGHHWEHCGWGGGGFYWSCAFHPASDGVIYVGGDVGGVYKTEDSGRHWRFSNRGLADYAVYSLGVDAGNPDTVYAGTVGGICKSTDAGETWRLLEQTARDALAITAERGKSVRNIAVDPSDGSVVYAGTPDGRILRSEDGGVSWTKRHEVPGGSVSSVTVCGADPRLLIAAHTSAGLLKSVDGGTTWAALQTSASAISAVFAPGNPDLIYGAFAKDGIWLSTDGGRTWQSRSNGIRQQCVVQDVCVHPSDPDTVFCIATIGWDGFFYRSDDGGRSWEEVRSMQRDFDANPTVPDDYGGRAAGTCPISNPRNLTVNPRDPEELFIAGNWRLCLSSDGGKTWQERDRGADITCVTDIRFCGSKTYVTAMDEGLLVSEDGGDTWRQLCPLKYDTALSGHQWRVLAWQEDGRERLVSTCSLWEEPINLVLISEDGGESFHLVGRGLPDRRPTVNCMWGQSYPRALAADPRDGNVLYMGMDGDPEPAAGRAGGGVFKSTDGGYTWRQLAEQPGSRRMFYGLAVDPTSPDRIYWGASGEGGGLYRSEDGGAGWQKVFDGEDWVFNVVVSPTGVVYCPGANLWRSTDHGETWTQITDFPGLVSIVGLEIDPRDEDTIWLSRVTWGSKAAGGVYRTRNGGRSWQEITGDLSYCKPIVLRFNAATNELWAGGVGLFKISQ